MDEDRKRLEIELMAAELERINRLNREVVHNERNIMEIFLVVATLIAGIRLFVDPPVIQVDLHVYWRYAWRTLLVGGSLVVLTGLMWSGRDVTALAVKQVGYLALGFGAMAFGVANFAPVTILFGVACVTHVCQIGIRVARVNPDLTLLNAVKRGLRVVRRRRR